MESILFQEPNTRSRFLAAPCLKEREQYLVHLMRRGYGPDYLRGVSSDMLRVVRFLELTIPREVGLDELERARQAATVYRGPDRRGKRGETTGRFPRVAKGWLGFHGLLAVPPVPMHPCEKEITEFTEFLRSTKGASPLTIYAYGKRLKLIFSWLAAQGVALRSVTLNDIDEFFKAKRAEGWRIPTHTSHSQALKAFFLYAEGRGWCESGLARGVRNPARPRYSGVARGPTWPDVRRLLRYGRKITTVPGLRAHAMMLLCSIYALRSSEVSGLRLVDIDWREETFCVKRAKRGGYQRYPLQYEVGEAILRYLKVRPQCACCNVFVTFQQPYRPVTGFAMWQIVSRQLEILGIQSATRGPHALRHACATHLLKIGTPLKDIADFLGHRDTNSVSFYARFDTRSLRKVAAFNLKGL